MINSFDAKEYWATRAENYRETMQTEYHKSRLAMIDSLIGNTTIGQIIDFGCGDGVYSIVFAAQGCKVTAIDIDPSMVEVTRQRLSDFGGG